MSISMAPTIPDHQAPQWLHGELNGVANAPGLPDSVRALITRHSEVFFAWRNASHAARAAEAAAQTAEKIDAQNRSAALATNKPAARPQLPEAIKARDEAQRQEADLRRALAMIEESVKADVAAHSAGWATAITDEITRRRADIAKLADEMQAAFLAIAQLGRVWTQVTDPYRAKVWGAFDMSSSPVAVAERVTGALTALRDAAAPPRDDTFWMRVGPASLHDTLQD